uniref:Uncharacterized protein n=1 Tax=Anguilla anguilla TaxID=7936 RepID=A0A0E9WG66_ANGAN
MCRQQFLILLPLWKNLTDLFLVKILKECISLCLVVCGFLACQHIGQAYCQICNLTCVIISLRERTIVVSYLFARTVKFPCLYRGYKTC